MAGFSIAAWTRRLVVLAAAISCLATASAVRGESFAEPFTSFAVSTDEPGQFGAIPLPETAPADTACDEACMGALRRCCCPGWKHYAIFDVLFLQRNNQSGGQPLVVDPAGSPILTAQSLQPSIGSGVRLFYGQLVTDSIGWEIGYLGIYGMFGEATAAGNTTLNAPGPLGVAVNNFSDADTARATYWSTLNMAEANIFYYDCREECGSSWCPLTGGRRNCHCIDWLAGFVWAGLNEQSSLTMACCNPPEPASYTVNTATNYYGGQIGQRGRREWERWAVEGWWKTALCGTTAFQSGEPIAGTLSGPERGAVAANATGLGFIGSLNATLIYKLTDTCGIRAGYNAIWLTNAALAPTQFDFSTSSAAGTGLNDNGGIFLHGANLGVETRW